MKSDSLTTVEMSPSKTRDISNFSREVGVFSTQSGYIFFSEPFQNIKTLLLL